MPRTSTELGDPLGVLVRQRYRVGLIGGHEHVAATAQAPEQLDDLADGLTGTDEPADGAQEDHRVPSVVVAMNGAETTDAGRVPPVSLPVELNRTRSRARRTHRTAFWLLPSMVITS